jgi:hypothetical protein
MHTDARARIDTHRLMRTAEPVDDRVSSARTELERARVAAREKFKRRLVIYALTFVVAFVFTSGVSLLGLILWVQPDDLLSIVLNGLFAALVFVATFAWIRMHVLHTLLREHEHDEEDPGMHHHWCKSIAYGLVALVLALALVSVLVTVVQAVESLG